MILANRIEEALRTIFEAVEDFEQYSIYAQHDAEEGAELDGAEKLGAVTIIASETGDNDSIKIAGEVGRDGELRFLCTVPEQAAGAGLLTLVSLITETIDGIDSNDLDDFTYLELDHRTADEDEIEAKTREHALVYTFTAL